VVVAVTKVDKASQSALARCRRELQEKAPEIPVVWTSAATGQGMDELWRQIRQRTGS
jgi:Ni2+-binding GTPase involved in maturation of urease and hydrogenase